MKVRSYFPWLLLLPALFIYAGFSFLPLLRAVSISFQKYRMESPEAPTWSGWENYHRLFSDPQVVHSALVTIRYALIVVPAVILVSLVCALTLHALGRRVSWVRPLILLPMVVAPSIIAVIWFTLFDGSRGGLNWALGSVGLSVEWLGASLALPSVALAQAWAGIAFGTLLFSVALNGIPEELYEAAAIDGAGAVSSFFSITLPGIAKVLALLLMLVTLGAMKDFTYPFVITRGGPAGATETLSYQIYRTAFVEAPLDLGYACALSVVFAIILLVISFILLRLRQISL